MYRRKPFSRQWIQVGILAGILAAILPLIVTTSANAADVQKTNAVESAKPAVKAQEVTNTLSAEFDKPSDAARPWVYVFAQTTNTGDITAHLEALKEKGIGGFVLYGGDPAALSGQPRFQHWMNEADRLGLVMGANNCASWPAGGGWVTPELRPWIALGSTMDVDGGKPFAGKLPPLAGVGGTLTVDLSVQAFPIPSELPPEPVITVSGNPDDILRMRDGNVITSWLPPQPSDPKAKREPNWILIDFGQPREVDCLWLQKSWFGYVQCSDDGTTFKPVTQLDLPYFGSLPKTKARYFRLWMPSHQPSWDAVSEFAIGTRAEVERRVSLMAKRGLTPVKLEKMVDRLERFHEPLKALDSDVVLPMGKMVDLTDKVSADGTLQWDVPPGRWRIVRVARTNLDKVGGFPMPDYLNPESMRLDMEKGMGKLGVAAGDKAGKVFRYYYEDNNEIGVLYNWTPGMLEEFSKRRGYDAKPYLAAMSGSRTA